MAARVHFETVATGGGGGSGTVTNVSALTIGTAGTNLSSTVVSSTTTPVITLNVPTASAVNRGALSSADWSTFNGKQALLVSGTNIKTVNGNSLLGSGNLVISGGGTPSGVAGSVQFSDGTNFASDAANFFYDDTNNRLGIGTNTPSDKLEVNGNIRVSANAFVYSSGSGGAVSSGMRFDSATPKASVFVGSAERVIFGNSTVATIKGSGTTSGTTALLVQNSAGTNLLKVEDGGNVGIGTNTLSARLQVKGDGTNPIARFEDNSDVPMLRIENNLMRFGASTPFGSLQFPMSGTTFSANNNGTSLGFYSQFSIAASSDRFDFGFSGDTVANTAGTVSHLALVRNFAASAGSANYRPLSLNYTINNSGVQTGTATGIFLNATETNLNGMSHNLLDLQTGGVSKFKVTNTDSSFSGKLGVGTDTPTAKLEVIGVGTNNIFNCYQADGTTPALSVGFTGNFTTYNSFFVGGVIWANSFTDLRLGTNGFGTAITIKSADGKVGIGTNSPLATTHIKGSGTTSATTALLVQNSAGATALQVFDNTDTRVFGALAFNNGNTFIGNFSGALNITSVNGANADLALNPSRQVNINNTGSYTAQASAILQVDSTTKGFLPPRMTQAEINAIALPATGLMAFNLDIGQVCVYDGAIWHKLNQSIM